MISDKQNATRPDQPESGKREQTTHATFSHLSEVEFSTLKHSQIDGLLRFQANLAAADCEVRS